jgi:hypothetical protein
VASNAQRVVGLLEGKVTNEQQMEVLIHAFEIFIERNADRKDLWAEYGVEDSLLHIRSKAGRLARLLGEDQRLSVKEKDLDEAYDLINYCVFFIRHMLGWVPNAD